MRRSAPFALALLLLAGAAIVACNQQAPAPAAPEETVAEPVDLVARGEYLVSILDCDICHTPKIMGEMGPEPDMSRRLSGHPDGPLEVPPAGQELGQGFSGGKLAFAQPLSFQHAPVIVDPFQVVTLAKGQGFFQDLAFFVGNGFLFGTGQQRLVCSDVEPEVAPLSIIARHLQFASHH